MYDSDLTPADRVLRGRLAAHTSWARTEDRSARTAPARRAALDRFEREVDPEGTLDAAERARRVEHARKAYFTGLALKSARARRNRQDSAVTREEPASRHTDSDSSKAEELVPPRRRRRVVRKPFSW